jgi:hypothetical protein
MVNRSNAKTRREENERIVATTPFKYEDEEIVNKFVETFTRLSW